jgi:hypothetical protein
MSATTRSIAAAAACVLVAVAGSGCSAIRAHPSSVTPEAGADAIDSNFVDLQIDNHNWSDVVIFIVHGSTRSRLGSAHTASTTAFRFPSSFAFANSVSLVAAPVGSPSQFESEHFRVLVGQRVYWSIESNLSRSSLVVR